MENYGFLSNFLIEIEVIMQYLFSPFFMLCDLTAPVTEFFFLEAVPVFATVSALWFWIKNSLQRWEKLTFREAI